MTNWANTAAVKIKNVKYSYYSSQKYETKCTIDYIVHTSLFRIPFWDCVWSICSHQAENGSYADKLPHCNIIL